LIAVATPAVTVKGFSTKLKRYKVETPPKDCLHPFDLPAVKSQAIIIYVLF
jgi:hypothetical protein